MKLDLSHSLECSTLLDFSLEHVPLGLFITIPSFFKHFNVSIYVPSTKCMYTFFFSPYWLRKICFLCFLGICISHAKLESQVLFQHVVPFLSLFLLSSHLISNLFLCCENVLTFQQQNSLYFWFSFVVSVMYRCRETMSTEITSNTWTSPPSSFSSIFSLFILITIKAQCIRVCVWECVCVC